METLMENWLPGSNNIAFNNENTILLVRKESMIPISHYGKKKMLVNSIWCVAVKALKAYSNIPANFPCAANCKMLSEIPFKPCPL